MNKWTSEQVDKVLVVKNKVTDEQSSVVTMPFYYSIYKQLVYSSTCSLVNSSTRRLLFRVNEVGVSDVVQHLGEELT